MRFIVATAAALSLLLVSSMASAYELRASPKAGSTDPSTAQIGDQVTYELFLDTQGESDIVLFAFSVVFDPNVLGYNRVETTGPTYVLYTGGKGASFLEPFALPMVQWAGTQPTGLRQINSDWIANAFNPTVAVSANEALGEFTLNVVGPGSGALDLSFMNGGNTVQLSNDVIVSDEVTIAITNGVITVPEPAAAAMALSALMALGVIARGHRRV